MKKKNLLNEYSFDQKHYLKYTKSKDKNSEDSSLVLIDNEFQKVALDSSAIFFGGLNNMMRYIQMNIRYPEAALDNGIEGTIVITFIIDKNGMASQFEVISPIVGGGLDREALRVIQLTKDFWLPAFLDGAPTATKINFPLTFSLSK